MSEPIEREVEVFNRVLQLPEPQRIPYLEDACGDDGELRERVANLLKAEARAGQFLSGPATAAQAVHAAVGEATGHTAGALAVIAEQPGDRIGRYKLLQQIGEGGCGVVYLAEQEEPVRRRVAFKIIKLGMDTKSVIARFEAERQALALMDHPGIARVLDAGATDTGRPYFVMELVRGTKITQFCDENRLDTKERLKLFIKVCHAVQHAHQKGIIHRDLKPSNILVTVSEPEDPGTPKVIDFGIAKATQGRLTDQTVFTALEQFIGTPAYMSPEQAVLTTQEVDTRSDIYSLGVLLYELLTSRTPFDQRELIEAGLDTMRQVIRERDPVPPSTRLSTLGRADLLTVAQYRQLEPPGLIHSIRGDLDWIVMKCLQKDRARRYETANGLALDVGRHLHNEPVMARPDSLGYRAGKFIRRHRAAVTVVTIILLSLAAGLVGTITQTLRADRAAERAKIQRDFAVRQLSRAEAINDLNTFLLTDAAPHGKPFTTGDLLAQAEQLVRLPSSDTVENRVELLVSIGRQYQLQEKDGKARELLSLAYDLSRGISDPAIRAEAAASLGDAYAVTGDFKRGEALFQEAMTEFGDVPEFAIQRVFCLLRGSHVARESGNVEAGLERALTARRILEETGQGSSLLKLTIAGDVAESYRMAGRDREADQAFAVAFAQLKALGREKTERAGTFLNNWGLVLRSLGRPLEAVELFRRAIAISSADGGEANISPMLMNNLARELYELGRYDEAASYSERAYDQAKRAGNKIAVGLALSVRVKTYCKQGRLDLTETVMSELETIWRGMYPENHTAFVALANGRAEQALARGDLTSALTAVNQGIELAGRTPIGRLVMPIILRTRSAILLRAAQPDQALDDAMKALSMELELAGPDVLSSWLGRAHLAVARAQQAKGLEKAARQSFLSARKHLQPTLGPEHAETLEAIRGAVPP
jgi:tetratricopeptide (TPR) repeat protein/tRNA A-37 threonylcarbamoyl transferase component Bud32